jgi:hypothetical protein
MKKRKREIARAGIFGSVDNPQIVLAQDLQEIAETWADVKTAPVKLGSHWAEGNPRLGNVVSVTFDVATSSLWAEIEEHDVLAKAVDEDGFYPDVSIGAKARASDGKMYLHHLAYLGDEPPAVKGLYQQIAEPLETAPDIAASDAGSVRELPSPSAKQLYLSDTPPAGAVKNMSGAAGGFASSPPAAKGAISNKESVVTDEEFNAIKAENEKMRKEISEYRDILVEKAVKEKEEDKAKLKEAADGKLSEAEMDSLMELSDTFAEGKTIDLSDGGKKSSLRPIQFLAQLMAKLPQPVAPGVLNLSDPAPAEKKENLAQKMMGKM